MAANVAIAQSDDMNAQPQAETAASEESSTPLRAVKTEEKLIASAEDRDSLTVLPLCIVPLETRSLQRGRLVKNVHLTGVIEFFKDEVAGSGQLYPDQLPEHFGWEYNSLHPDLVKIRQLASLNSFDIYSLRIELRKLGINVDNEDQLKLSDEKKKELGGYMTNFTAPLMKQVYGSAENRIDSFDQLVGMFYSPNKDDELRNLRLLAEKLDIKLEEVPRFLEDYADIFLSLAYFKEQLDTIVPRVMEFLEYIPLFRKNHQLRNDRQFMAACDITEPRLNNIITSITGRFENFDQHSANLWENITAERFRQVRKLIKSHHATVGGVLCGLHVKMNAWQERFGEVQDGAAIMRRSEFLMSDMRQGLQKIEEIEKSAPQLANVD